LDLRSENVSHGRGPRPTLIALGLAVAALGLKVAALGLTVLALGLTVLALGLTVLAPGFTVFMVAALGLAFSALGCGRALVIEIFRGQRPRLQRRPCNPRLEGPRISGARCRVRTCDFLRVKQALYH
jgi:hypothetical protein